MSPHQSQLFLPVCDVSVICIFTCMYITLHTWKHNRYIPLHFAFLHLKYLEIIPYEYIIALYYFKLPHNIVLYRYSLIYVNSLLIIAIQWPPFTVYFMYIIEIVTKSCYLLSLFNVYYNHFSHHSINENSISIFKHFAL